MSPQTAKIELPPKLIPVFEGPARYRGAYGGRGSGKSRSFALMAAVFGYQRPLRILCARELQSSIKDSVHNEVAAAIKQYPWLASHYEVGESYIRGKNGTEFIFKGLRHNYREIKSTSDIGICWVEEAEAVSEQSWMTLIPTIRSENSEIWLTWNPENEKAPTNVRFLQNPPPDSKIVRLNYYDNPWFPDVLRAEMEHDRARDIDKYRHVWLGEYLSRPNKLVFQNWTVEEFETDKDAIFRFGADWGFAQDPTVLIRCYIQGRKLYIDYEAYRVGCEIVDTPSLFLSIPEAEKWPIVADSSRPEMISYMQRNGFSRIVPAVKGPKSIEDGIEWLKSFDIIVHPRCVNTINELSTYSYKIDPQTQEVLPVLEDKNNHGIDALRYACEGVRRMQSTKTKTTTRPRMAGWMSA